MPASSPVYSLLEVAPEEDGPFVTPRTRLAAMAGRNRNGTAPSQADPLQAGELCRGHVLSSEDRDIRVVLEDGAETPARRAAGCLLRPEPGDTVLVHRPEAGEAYVLCVLDKAVQAAVLDAPGTLRIEAFERLDLAAPEVRLRGKTGRLEFLDLTLLARTLTAKAGRIAGIAAAVDSTIGDLTQTIRLAVRQVETEVVRAGGIRQFIRERFLVRAGRAAVVAEDEVTVDARKIHLG